MIVSMVVRVRSGDDANGIAGVVEIVDNGSQIIVRNEDELLAAIHSAVRRSGTADVDRSGQVDTE